MVETEQGQETAAGQTVLHRLLQARDQARAKQGETPALPRPQPPTAKRAAQTAAARAFDGLYGLPSSVLELTPSAVTLAELGELLPQPALLSVVQGPDEAVGVVALCPTLMTALIEMQTLGRITARPIESRKPTRSDAMICADFVNLLLDELQQEIAPLEGFECFSGFRYASFMNDQRPLLLMLEDIPYRSLSFRLSVGQSPEREGTIFIALPQKRFAAMPPLPEKAGKDVVAEVSAESQQAEPPKVEIARETLADQVAEAPIELSAILCRHSMPLRDLGRLKPGQTLPLPRISLSNVQIETPLGQRLASGKLGEANGYFAIRLHGKGEDEKPQPTHTALNNSRFAGAAAKASSENVEQGAVSPTEPPIADLDQPDGFRKGAEPAAELDTQAS